MLIFLLLDFFLEFIIYRLFLFPISPLVRQITMLSPSEDFFQCLLVLSVMSRYYLGHCSISPWYSRSGNWNCTKGFSLIAFTVMLQNYHEGKIVRLYIPERLFAERMHQKKVNAETLCKIWFVLFVRWFPDYLVVWATMMWNKCFMITIYTFIYIYIYIYIYIHIYML